MKKYTSFLSVFLALVLLLPPAAYAEEGVSTAGEPFSVVAAAAILVEGDTGEVLYELNADEVRAPASITKVMTGLLTVEAVERGELSLDQQVTLGADIYQGIGADGSSIQLKEGEILTVRDLLYAALLPSANEACNALAVEISGSILDFVALMNKRASELGMTSTQYRNTHGYPDDAHYTTARDLATLCREAITHPDFRTAVSSSSYTIPPTNLHEKERVLKNSNALVSNAVQGYKYSNAIGIKTGYTNAAGRCLASAAQKGPRTLVAILLGGNNWIDHEVEVPDNFFRESRRMLEYGFNSFSQKTILDKIEPIDTIPVTLCAEQDYVTVQPAESITATLPNELESGDFTRRVSLPDTLEAPIEKGAVLGSITVEREGVVYGTVDLIASTGLERSQFLYTLSQIRWVFSHLWVRLLLLAIVVISILFSLRRALYGPSRRRRRRRDDRVYSTSYRGKGR